MATRDYCSGASMELGFLLEKLQKLSTRIDRIPSIDKYKMFSQVQELNIIITELNDRISEMTTSCSTVEVPDKNERSRPSLSAGSKFNKNTEEFFDYDFGG